MLLLKDLCSRLPYGVKCNRYGNVYQLVDIDIKRELVYLLREETYVPYSISRGDIIKPYLRPMSSMTEEEKKEWYWLQRNTIQVYCYEEGDEKTIDLPYLEDLIDWLNSHHFDYRGLIEKGLALEAPEGMYKHFGDVIVTSVEPKDKL